VNYINLIEKLKYDPSKIFYIEKNILYLKKKMLLYVNNKIALDIKSTMQLISYHLECGNTLLLIQNRIASAESTVSESQMT